MVQLLNCSVTASLSIYLFRSLLSISFSLSYTYTYTHIPTRPPTSENTLMAELRRKWTIVLRECQKLDPERVGSVSRTKFLDALVFAKMGRSMNNEFMHKLADTYMIQSTNGELYVDYLTCFRNYLNELISILPANTNEFRVKPGHPVKEKLGNHPWDFMHTKPSDPGTNLNPNTSLSIAFKKITMELKGKEIAPSSSLISSLFQL